MVKIKNIILLCIMALQMIAFIGCVPNYWHKPGGPYYFQSFITYQGLRPNREITEDEALKLASQGYAYAVASFNENGQPTYIERRYRGKVDKYDFFYENGLDHFSKIISEDADGEKKVYFYGQKKGWVKIP
ncbi:MAG: hypothetical protein ACHP9Y_05695 [Gammaproteobacteria bacterium]